MRSYSWRDAFIRALEKFKRDLDDSYVSSKIHPSNPDAEAKVTFNSQPPDWALEELAALGVPVEVRVIQGIMSERERLDVTPEIH